MVTSYLLPTVEVKEAYNRRREDVAVSLHISEGRKMENLVSGQERRKRRMNQKSNSVDEHPDAAGRVFI